MTGWAHDIHEWLGLLDVQKIPSLTSWQASLLRQIVAGPRARHPEAGLDLCYVTDNIIATSGPSSTYPQRAYRNPTDELVKFLDQKHGSKWSIWEFRAEGTGYPDEEVYNRIRHYPWPDHHPPPFALIPNIMASMRDWLKGPEAEDGRVVVVHCKAGKGRSGTVACSYLISEEGWAMEDALARFTARRMRSGFGEGISIPSQQRWVRYVAWWMKHGKVYVERQIEILEIHVWGLRDGVKVAVEGFLDAGRVIKTFHTFSTDERTLMKDEAPFRRLTSTTAKEEKPLHQNGSLHKRSSTSPSTATSPKPSADAALFRPSTPLILPTSDINIDFERRNKAAYGFTMVTSVAHVWFNAFFESQFSSTDPEDHNPAQPPPPNPLPDSGVFSIPWHAMDGIRGSTKKGTRAFDRLSVVWRASSSSGSATSDSVAEKMISQPASGEPVTEPGPTDWRAANHDAPGDQVGRKDLGLRTESPAQGLSKANSVTSAGSTTPSREYTAGDESGSEAGVRAWGPQGEEAIDPVAQSDGEIAATPPATVSTSEPASASAEDITDDLGMKRDVDLGMEEKVTSSASVTADSIKGTRMGDGGEEGRGVEGLPELVEHIPGQILKDK